MHSDKKARLSNKEGAGFFIVEETKMGMCDEIIEAQQRAEARAEMRKKNEKAFPEENKTVLFEYIAEMQKEIDELKQKIQTLEPLKIYLPNLPQDGNFDLDEMPKWDGDEII